MQLPAPVDLTGTWRATLADEGLRRSFAEVDHPETGWHDLAVPGHWRSSPAFADEDGPVLYRRHFEADPPGAGERSWLVLDGLFYQGDVWLDGAYLGDTEGYFVRHTFEVTEASRDRREHVLAVEVACDRPEDRSAKRNITGAFQHSDSLDPDWNPGGIWRPVRIERTGAVRLRSLRVLCLEATAARAVVALRAELDTDAARRVRLRTTIAGVDDVAERPVAEGSNFVEWQVVVPEPALWWPRSLGEQPLHELEVVAEVDGAPSHVIRRRVGLRSSSWKGWVLSVNGERLFLKGSHHLPTRMALAEASAEEVRADVARAVETGLDLLRLHAHVTRPELYDAADEAGLLLWQDMPLQWGYARGIRKQAVRQAEAAVDLLGHHPSIVLWCGHDEPLALDAGTGHDVGEVGARRLGAQLAGQQLPGWNKTVLDRSVKRALERADPSRRTIAHSGVLPHAGSTGTDTHVWFGWYQGDERDLGRFCRSFPRLARFVGAFGAQAVPVGAGFMEPGRWPDLDWERLERTHGLQTAVFERLGLAPASFPTFEAWQAATQAYQAALVRHHVETLRRLKYRPTGGFCQLAFADAHPAVSFSVLGHDRRPKPAHAALAAACRPVIVVADRPPATLVPGAPLALDVHVVSDLRQPLHEVIVDARLEWDGGERRWRWQGDVPADACVRVGTVQAIVPDEPGRLALGLDLVAGSIEAGNRYEAEVVPAG